MTKDDSGKSPKGKKTKHSKGKGSETDVVPYEVRLKAITAISKPLANEKQTKRLYKLIKRSVKEKIVRRGVKEVCKGIRTGACCRKKGIAIIAGDVTPIDVISHMAYYCEEQGINYIYVPSKVDLGTAAKTKRPTSCVFITPPRETKEKLWDESSKQLFAEMKEVCIEEMSQIHS